MSWRRAPAFGPVGKSPAPAYRQPLSLATCLLALACILATQAGCKTCQGPGGGDPQGTDGGPDARLDALPDAGDAGGPDGHPWGLDPAEWEVEHPPCDATEIQLPPTGDTCVSEPRHHNGRVVYANDWDTQNWVMSYDIFLYDLRTCCEYTVTMMLAPQEAPDIWGDEVLFTGAYWLDAPLYEHGPLGVVLFDIPSLSYTQVVDQRVPGSRLRYNGRYVLSDSWEYQGSQSVKYLTIWDLTTAEKFLLVEANQGPDGLSLSPTHAAWKARPGGEQIYSLFFMELETRVVTRIELAENYGHLPHPYTATWGDWVLWEDSRYDTQIYGWRISTGEELRITDNGSQSYQPTLRGNIACFSTVVGLDETLGVLLFHLVVRDMETGVERRVTREPHHGYRCGDVESGWLVYRKETLEPCPSSADARTSSIHAVDLVAAGILDESGQSVLPE